MIGIDLTFNKMFCDLSLADHYNRYQYYRRLYNHLQIKFEICVYFFSIYTEKVPLHS